MTLSGICFNYETTGCPDGRIQTWLLRSLRRPLLTSSYASSFLPKQLRIKPFMANVSGAPMRVGRRELWRNLNAVLHTFHFVKLFHQHQDTINVISVKVLFRITVTKLKYTSSLWANLTIKVCNLRKPITWLFICNCNNRQASMLKC